MPSSGSRPLVFEKCYTPDPVSGCWLWNKSLAAAGYGRIRHRGKRLLAHRYSWTIHRGPFPPGLWVLHKCDVRACVNPDHLFLGTAEDNAHDRDKKGRNGREKLQGERAGMAKLTEADVLAIRSDMRLQRVIAEDYGLTQSAVSQIKRRARWKHLS